MKKTLLLAILMPSVAYAHAGGHSGGFAETIGHALTQPDHLGIALGVLALGYGLYRTLRG